MQQAVVMNFGHVVKVFRPRSGTMTAHDHRHAHSHSSNLDSYLQREQFLDAFNSLQLRGSCRDSCAELLEVLRLEMLKHMLDILRECNHLPQYLVRPDIKDLFSHLLALEGLLHSSFNTKLIFDDIVEAYYPDNVQTFFETFTLRIHNDTHRQKFLKNVGSAVERSLYHTFLQQMKEATESGSKQRLRRLQNKFSDFIQAMAIPLHDDMAPPILFNSYMEYYTSEVEHCPLFTRAVKLKLAPEALLLYDAGAVGNKELGLLAKDPDVQRMLKSEEDNSVLAVFLRKVLHKPRSLESLAEMQVSRLLRCHAPGDKEKTARELGLLEFHVERVLLRGQCGQYKAALKQADKQADNEKKAGTS